VEHTRARVVQALQRPAERMSCLPLGSGWLCRSLCSSPHQHVQPGAPPARRDRAFDHGAAGLVEHVGHGGRRRPGVERDGRVGLRIEVDHQRAQPVLLCGTGQP